MKRSKHLNFLVKVKYKLAGQEGEVVSAKETAKEIMKM